MREGHLPGRSDYISGDRGLETGSPRYYGKEVEQEHGRDTGLFKYAAEEGNAEAQYRLGQKYYRGEGVPKDLAKAYACFTKAAARHYKGAMYIRASDAFHTPEALFAIGQIYESGEGVGQDRDKALALYIRSAQKGYGEAVSKLKDIILTGDADALIRIGQLPQKERSLEEVFENAVRKYEQSAVHGDPEAQYVLGKWHDSPRMRGNDAAKAAGWFAEAARQGHAGALDKLIMKAEGSNAEAQFLLAGLYETGGAVPRDYGKAHAWYCRAGENGHAAGMYDCGRTHEKGLGTSQNYEQAMDCYEEAARNGDPEARKRIREDAAKGNAVAQYHLGILCEGGKVTGHGKETACGWYEKAAGGGHAGAMRRLGELCRAGKDAAKSRDWFRGAAETGDSEAAFELAEMCRTGEGGESDLAGAIRWYEKAALLGNAGAKMRLAEMYRAGEGVPRDPARAARSYEDVGECEENSEDDDLRGEALFKLGMMHYEGEGIPRDLSKAAQLFEDCSCSPGEYAVDAMLKLSEMYENGEGVEQDLGLAAEWGSRAAEFGGFEACERMNHIYEVLYEKGDTDTLTYYDHAAGEWMEMAPEVRDMIDEEEGGEDEE